MDNLLDKLNEDQIKPVCDTEGAVLVLAGAGSGKTRVLTSRIGYILRENKADLGQILAITFTNKAAGEMKERLSRELNRDFNGNDGKWICTIHSMCVKFLRAYGDKVGVKPNFSIYTETERSNIVKKSFKELDFDDDKLLKSVKYHIGNAKMLGLDPDAYGRKYADERNIDDVVRIYERYNKHLSENNSLDFDDLLIYTLRLLRYDKETSEYLSDKFKYILVDEFQDTNAVQYEIVKLLAKAHGNIFVVGDDDQSIYGWRGAKIENILRFDRDFPNVKTYKLERNYRSTGSILKLANSIIQNNSARKGKELWTDAGEGVKPTYTEADEESGEALFTAKIISNSVREGGKYSDFAVLMRINALTRSYEQEFTKYGIPYKVFGGFKFFERKEVKDILAYLRLVSNPFDGEAIERIINVPKRGIGSKTIEVMNEYAFKNGLTFYDAVLDCDRLSVSKGTKDKLAAFGETVKDLIISSLDMSVSELVKFIIVKTDLRSAYDDGTDEGDGKLANIEEFIASVDDFNRLNPQATLDEYLNQITLYSDLDDMDDGNYVTLATIHAVKGLEFDTVFICGLEEGIMPTSRSEHESGAVEEERRLMYVAITRARKRLFLSRSKSRYLYGRRNLTAPSMFIKELSRELEIPVPKSGYEGYGDRLERWGSRFEDMPSSRNRDYDDSGYQSDIPSSSSSSGSFKPSWGGVNKPKPQQNENGAAKYSAGMKVKHAKFGVGMIIAVKNGGSAIIVAFDGQGIKELSTSLAPLQII